MKRRHLAIVSDPETDSDVGNVPSGPPTPLSRPTTPEMSASQSHSMPASPHFVASPLVSDDASSSPHTPPPELPAIRKRTMDEARSASMPPSPEKKKPRAEAQSAIRSAIEMSSEGVPRGLMKFFRPCTKGEYDEQVARFTEEHHGDLEQRAAQEATRNQLRDDKAREGDRIRQQRHRQVKRDNEIARGERTPGGTKRKVCFATCIPFGRPKLKAHSAHNGRAWGPCRIVKKG